MKLLNSFWFVDVGRLLYNGPTISHFFINSRIKRWIDWKKWKRLMGGPLSLWVKWRLRNEANCEMNWFVNQWMKQTRQWKQSNWTRHQAAPTAARQAPQQTPNKWRNERSPSFDGFVEGESEWKKNWWNLMKSIVFEWSDAGGKVIFVVGYEPEAPLRRRQTTPSILLIDSVLFFFAFAVN